MMSEHDIAHGLVLMTAEMINVPPAGIFIFRSFLCNATSPHLVLGILIVSLWGFLWQ